MMLEVRIEGEGEWLEESMGRLLGANFPFVDVSAGIHAFSLWKYISVCMLYFNKNLTEKEYIFWHASKIHNVKWAKYKGKYINPQS